jgi:NAD(P)-dependent dehydrogenase (short-subunit alcohol dehydrogenase family)
MLSTNRGWTLADAPRVDGKIAVVTGATSGLGFETARGFVRQGATTVLTGRNADKGAQAVSRIQRDIPSAKVRFESLDLASLDSIASFAASVITREGKIDILVNNAGVMGLPNRQQTRDGFEMQIGVNYLGHFALTALLKDALRGGRVIHVASLARRRGVLNLSDLQSETSYVPMRAYGQSKLAMLIFALELQRRSERNGWNMTSIAAHPGWARTEIIGNGIGNGKPGLKAWLIQLGFDAMAQSAADGALPVLYAAMAREAEGGAYYGPTGRSERKGPPGPSRVFPHAADPDAGSRLWAASEALTHLSFG